MATSQTFDAIRRGDAREFDLLFQKYFDPLTRQVARMVESVHVAEELVQDVFLRMWSARAELHVRGDLVSYLRRSARNRALDWLRREDLHREWEQSALYEASVFSSEPHNSDQDDITRFQVAVAECLARMPERRRIVCDLRWRQDVGPSAIAARLGISAKTVEAHLASGTRDLRARLGSISEPLTRRSMTR